METIEEQSKCEGSISSQLPLENVRICLVGDVVHDSEAVEAAHTFGVPVIISDTGLAIIDDYEWRTYFVLNEFEGPVYDAIHKNKQSILGPPALKYAAEKKEGLPHNARPIYSYSMRGVVTCFTGIRKKDELTKLVSLIHSMGGCIRKDMNSKITHLISNHSGGDKYQYAKTFRLTVVRPAWVYAAWERRKEMEFSATYESFTEEHRLKAFEGQKICFFGFPEDEHQHMVEVLIINGGVPAELDDPECSHVVMPNSGGYFPETFTTTNTPESPQKPFLTNNYNPNIEDMEVDIPVRAEVGAFNAVAPHTEEADDDVGHFDERLVIDYDCNKLINQRKEGVPDELDEDDEEAVAMQSNASSTPKAQRRLQGAINTKVNISPIESTPPTVKKMPTIVDLKRCEEMESNAMDCVDIDLLQLDLKRKRESFDSISLISTESFVLPTSTKKPKLIRTGSISRTLKRSMSFVAERTPIVKMLRPRRISVALDETQNFSKDVDDSNCSLASIESTFNESMRKACKSKLGTIRERVTRSSSRKNKVVVDAARTPTQSNADGPPGDDSNFKTPKAPTKSNATPSARAANTPTKSRSFTKSLSQSFSNYSHNLNLGLGAKQSTSTATSTTITNQTYTANSTNTSTNPMHNTHAQNAGHVVNYTETAHLLQYEDAAASGCPPTLKGQISQIEAGNALTVVDKHTIQTKPEPKNNRTHILKSDWFWYTIQNGYADETDFLFGDYLDTIANTPNTERRDSLPISFNKRKRKRFSQRLQLEGTPLSSGKRRSSVSDAGLLSVSGSFFDCTTSPDKLEGGKLPHEPEASVCEPTPGKKSMRFNHFMDFFSTESNYVGILDTILNLFKIPLEESAETNDPLLNTTEIKAIFGNFLPIHEVHQTMLNRLRTIYSKWSEDCLIGEIILLLRDDLIKAYPPYINFFEQMKENLQLCDVQKPRFHAFLKINQTKPECGRQSLQDLMIRPVQRLPSISLLLKDILKHTNKSNPDYAMLEEALKAIKEVMMHINEDKRKTESRMAIFDIFNDIEGCPPSLVSSNRSFISKCEVTELSNNLSGRGDSLVFYLFSDTIEVCKKRSRGFNSAKSPGASKSHKHVKLISLNAILYVVDITDSPRAFALVCRQDKEKFHSFTISDEEVDKVVYIKTLCKQMAENACRTDTDKALVYRTSQEIEVDLSDINLSTLSKAFKLAARTRLKVGRAFSFNKTPSKLKRAVSTMMTSPFGSTNSLTPSSQLAQMRLASCTNIHEVADEEGSSSRSNRSDSPSAQSDVVVAPPLSVQPTRKNKSTLLNGVGRI